MEQVSENSAPQGDDAAPATMPLGKTLREARERLGLSVADAAGQIKLAPRQIEALEAEDFRHLPEMPFVRGFVRGYAKILQLDAQPLLASLPQPNVDLVQMVPASVDAPFPSAHSPQRQNLIWLGAALLLSVLVVALAVWHFTTPPGKSEAKRVETPVVLPDRVEVAAASPVVEAQPAAKMAQVSEAAHLPADGVAAPAPQAQPAKPVAQPGASAQGATLRLTFGEESWTEIRDRDGEVVSSQVNTAGSELRLNGQPPLTLVIGRASSARLYYRGKQVDLAPHTSSSSDVARLTLE